MSENKSSLGAWPAEKPVIEGYKRCSACGHAKLLTEFNKDKRRPDGRGYQCKQCQKKRAQSNYKKVQNRNKRKQRYVENKDDHRERARAYYHVNKESILDKQKKYHKSSSGKKVMQRAHAKRRQLMEENKGIPYTYADIVNRDSVDLEHPETGEMVNVPICGICGDPIWDLADMHLDHKVPISEGGLDCRDNMRCTHAKCNLSRPRKFDSESRVIE